MISYVYPGDDVTINIKDVQDSWFTITSSGCGTATENDCINYSDSDSDSDYEDAIEEEFKEKHLDFLLLKKLDYHISSRDCLRVLKECEKHIFPILFNHPTRKNRIGVRNFKKV